MTTQSAPKNWREARRLRTFELKHAGWTPQEIAEALGVSRGAVSQWMKAAEEGGLDALQSRPRPGRLSAENRNRLPALLSRGAEAYGFRGEALAGESLAGAEKKARREGKTLVFIDEAGLYLLPGRVRTYAPCGETSVLRVFQTRDHLSMMGAITPDGQLSVLTRDESLTGRERVFLLKQLHRQFGTNLLVIRDGGSIHKGEEVRTFLADGGSRLVWLESLPGYAPDLNPTEGVCNLLKQVEMRNLCCLNFEELRHELDLAVAVSATSRILSALASPEQVWNCDMFTYFCNDLYHPQVYKFSHNLPHNPSHLRREK